MVTYNSACSNASVLFCYFLSYFVESPSLALSLSLSLRAIAQGDRAFYLSRHLSWKSRLFPPYASMFCQASPVCSALSKFHYGMAGSARRCSLRLSAWHVTVCNAMDEGGCNLFHPPASIASELFAIVGLCHEFCITYGLLSDTHKASQFGLK